ncbi:hypothetical protein [Dietzia maris]|uniref:hypothetical protein n=1 Tax=Dietzia maris TaxID=37915 RepID=UPI00223B35C5|nr:hypothetical protein [Dietzia maris]MCT1434395.1 hypothetical protein [Dietzia maris]MCT1521480.1 hypothetical protein [Dietzia maris]
MRTFTHRTFTTLAALTMCLSASAVAQAQIPGAIDTGTVVITTSDRLIVSVDPAGANATQIAGTIRNTTGNTFRCAVPGILDKEYPAQVTEAEIVERSMAYYSRNIYQPIGGVELDIEGPIALDPLNFGSLMDYFPTGSMIEPLGDTRAEYMNIQAAQDDARIKGHTGDPRVGNATAFNIGGGATVNWTAQLGVPASGIRTDFDAAAMFYCKNTSGSPELHYVFAGYEPGYVPTTRPQR